MKPGDCKVAINAGVLEQSNSFSEGFTAEGCAVHAEDDVAYVQSFLRSGGRYHDNAPILAPLSYIMVDVHAPLRVRLLVWSLDDHGVVKNCMRRDPRTRQRIMTNERTLVSMEARRVILLHWIMRSNR